MRYIEITFCLATLVLSISAQAMPLAPLDQRALENVIHTAVPASPERQAEAQRQAEAAAEAQRQAEAAAEAQRQAKAAAEATV